jgi:predicted RNA-binding protein with PUA-like domain
MAKRHWLMKCEPAAYTIADLELEGLADVPVFQLTGGAE